MTGASPVQAEQIRFGGYCSAVPIKPGSWQPAATLPLHLLSDLRHSSVETQSIVVLDFGAQYSQLIARRIREQNVFSVVLPCTASLDEIRSYSPLGIILSGGPCSVYDQDAPNTDQQVFELGLPVLGICYGLQFMVHVLGGKGTRRRQTRVRSRGCRNQR